jgi:hypothetical protein
MQGERALLFSGRVVLTLGTLAIFCLSGIATAQSSQHLTTTGSTPTKGQSVTCEPPSVTLAQPPKTAFSAHRVTLKWNASVVSSGHGKAEDYCIYRSLRQDDPPVKGKCIECQLLGEVPAPATTYIDHTLTDGTTCYYYYVFAVNAVGMSGPSNEASAPIPADKPASNPPKGIPFCNATNLPEEGARPTQK